MKRNAFVGGNPVTYVDIGGYGKKLSKKDQRREERAKKKHKNTLIADATAFIRA